jgi:serine/threonine-protein kinase
MARLFLARTVDSPQRLVAIKTLRLANADDPRQIAMFAEEMRITRLLRHRHVVELVEAGVLHGQPFLVLEYIDGPSLRQLAAYHIESDRPMAVHLAVSLLAMACSGIHAAHELTSDWGRPLGLVHRDVCPQNIMVNRLGEAKVLDFGVAKVVDRYHQDRRSFAGRMAYTAPETIRGDPLDRRADVFALGVVLWELLTNRRLFFHSTKVGTMQAVLHDGVPPASAFNPNIPQQLDLVLQRALAKDRTNRYPTAADFQTAIVDTLPSQGPRAPLASDDVARFMARAYPQLLPPLPSLDPPMADDEMARRAARLSSMPAAGEDPSPDSAQFSWASVEVDLSDILLEDE